MTRKPDYVVNVYGDGELGGAISWHEAGDAHFHREVNKNEPLVYRVPYRIRVFLKPSAQEKRE